MRFSALLLLCALSIAGASPISTTVSANDVTVELFSSRNISAIQISPIGTGAWMRTCSLCPRQAITKSVQLNLAENGIHASLGSTAKELDLEGTLRLRTSDSNQEASAAGKWNITKRHGGLKILLTIPSEAYVVAALSGEASTDEPLASLKAMAVAIRTFALVNEDRHIIEGFGLCDSTHCQALHFGNARADVKRAVQQTAGETLWFGRSRAEVYYTQHCGGVTENVTDAWPKQHATYLTSHADAYCLRRSAAEWQTFIPLEQLETIFQSEGWRTPSQIQTVRVIKRSQSGRALLLEFAGPAAYSVVSASSFRFAIDRHLGWNRLRSDWYSVNIEQRSLRIVGKGYGHGIGLCQAGAFEMASEGHNYRDILGFYFPGTVPRVSPNDAGWRSINGSGFTLMTTAPSTDFQIEANIEWGKALTLFSPTVNVYPTILSMPTTELFRQTTGEPGWIIAATRGADIYLQPSAVLHGHESSENLMLHEFLHVLVEQESEPHTPIWLREGLVEALASSSRGLAPSQPMGIDELEFALSRPADKKQSQQAHLAAARIVNQLIGRYGISTVRTWLTKGVPREIRAIVSKTN